MLIDFHTGETTFKNKSDMTLLQFGGFMAPGIWQLIIIIVPLIILLVFLRYSRKDAESLKDNKPTKDKNPFIND